jgi:hypothetical protein
MMSKAKIALAAFAMALAFSAVASASGLAAEAGWMVEGKLLAAGETFPVAEATTRGEGNYILKIGNVELECETLKIEKGFITGLNKNGAKSLLFSGCAAATPNCTLLSSSISTLPLLSEATLDPPNALAAVIVFKPETGTVFATFKFSGASCAVSGVKAVSGTQAVLAPTAADEKIEQQLKAIELKAGELKAGSEVAKLKGSALVKLGNGKPWGFL